MSASRVLLPALAAAFLATAALAADPAPGPDHHGGMHAMMSMFSPEQMAMFMIDQRSDTAGMTPEQRRAYRQTERNKLMAMSVADKARMAADLQAKWDALPADEKTAALDRMHKMQARRAAGGGWGHDGGDQDGGAQ
ncbi:MAG TPA: hypothetical protein VIJ72_02810 [Rhizomicrobium sp.]